MEYEGIIPKGAVLGARNYGANAINNSVKQSEAQEILDRLKSLGESVSLTADLAAGAAAKLIGPRPEAISTEKQASPPSQGFLGELRYLIGKLECAHLAINSQLNRIDQSF